MMKRYLDSTGHPYSRTLTDKKIVSHGKVEKELDRLLMIREGKDPYHYYPSCAIVPKHSYARTIHKAIWQISSPTLYLSLKWMKRSTNLMVYDDNGRKQKIILPMLKAMGMEQSIGDNFMRKDMDRGCMPMLEHLLELYQEALANSSDYIIELFEVYRKGGKVPTRFNRNYE